MHHVPGGLLQGGEVHCGNLLNFLLRLLKCLFRMYYTQDFHTIEHGRMTPPLQKCVPASNSFRT